MNKRVLVADADEKFRNELAEALRKEFEVIAVAEDGERLLQILRDNSPDVLVLDLLLPQYDGITVLDRISAVQPTCNVFVVTGFISDYILSALEKRKISNLAKKPCSALSVVNWIEAVLQETGDR